MKTQFCLCFFFIVASLISDLIFPPPPLWSFTSFSYVAQSAMPFAQQGNSPALLVVAFFGRGIVRKWFSLQWESCKKISSFPTQISFQHNNSGIGFQRQQKGLRNQAHCENQVVQQSQALHE